MYQVLQMVVYGVHGVCRILQLEEKIVDHKCVSFYVLEPLAQPGTRYYLPSQNSAAMSKVRPLTDKERLESLLRDTDVQTQWIPEENRRKQHYRQLLSCADADALIGMVRCVEKHRRSQAEIGRKLHMCDENFLRDARRILACEMIQVLQVDESEINERLFGTIAKE